MKKMKTMKKAVCMALGALMALGAASCSPEKAVDEPKNKLHEDPVRAVFTLQEGSLKAGSAFENMPHQADFVAATTPAQVIEWEVTTGEGWHVTKGEEGFSVKNTEDHPQVVYQLTMEYYNAKGEKMNNQFFDNGQDKIHQHFFSQYKEVEIAGKTTSVRVSKKDELAYDYSYADELNGSFVGDSNPMGFCGFIKFVKGGTQFDLSVDLLHAAVSKFDEKGKASPFFLPSKVLSSTGQWDINVKLPVTVDGGEVVADAFDPAKVEINVISGHLHGTYSFHQNAMRTDEGQYIGRNYKLVYWKEGSQWVPDEANPDKVAVFASKRDAGGGSVIAFDIHYFDKDGEEITGQIGGEDVNGQYQHFFFAKDIKPAYAGKASEADRNDEGFFMYKYCDTKPWYQSNHSNGAPFIGETNPIGLKGYFNFLQKHKKFDLQIHLMHSKKSKLVDGKPSPFYAPTEKQLKQEQWLPVIHVPMLTYLDTYELELDSDYELDDIPNMSKDLSTYSESERTSLGALMDAFGISIETALQEFYLNFAGARGSAESGNFWF